MTTSSALHDPGGQVKLTVPPDVKSYTVFSDCGRYRWLLKRTWNYDLPRLLIIGMNPSIADLEYDDPTVRKECNYARAWGYGGITKCNVMDYRATDPRDLLTPGLSVQGTGNLDTIRIAIASHKDILLAWGNLHPKLARKVDPIITMLTECVRNVYCLGKTKAGNPRHPLYLSYTTQLQPFEMRKDNES